MPRPEVSLVIPIYNEEEVLPQLDERLLTLLEKVGVDSEVVFVDDGSKDNSLELLRAMVEREPRYRVVSFSRNFGHQRAITCGMDATRGKAVVVMDADLQDPPEVIVEMLAKWREGYDVVYGRRRSREGETWFKLLTAKIFYRLFAAMIPIEVPLDTGDFRLMSRRVVVTLHELRETHRFVRGLVSWVGFKQTAVEYDRAARVAGETKYPLRRMLAFALDGIMSFSILPLRVATYLGVIVGAASVLYAMSAIFAHSFLNATVPGWTTTVVLVSFLFSVQLLVTGVLGEYIGRIYEQVKGRPLYVVGERIRHKKARKRAQPPQDLRAEAVSGAAARAPVPVFPTAPLMPSIPTAPSASSMPSSPPVPSLAMPAASPASGSLQASSASPPPLPAKASRPPAVSPSAVSPSGRPPAVSPSARPPAVTSSPPASPSSSPGPVSTSKLTSKPAPPLPSAAKKSDKT